MMNLPLFRRVLKYLLPHLHLALLGGLLILSLTFSGAISLFMLKPVFDGILVKSKAELIENDRKAKPGEALRFVREFAGFSAHELAAVVHREKPMKAAKAALSARFNGYLRTGPVTDILIIVVFFIGGGILIKTMSEYCRRLVFLALNLRIMTRVRMEMYERVMTFSMPFFNEYKTGYLMNRVIGEVNVIQDIIVGSASGILTNLILVLFYFGMILYIDWKLTLILIAAFVPFIFLLDKLAAFLKRFQQRMQEILGAIMSVAQEAFAGIRLVIASNTQAFEAGRYRKAILDFQKIAFRIGRYDLLAAPLSELVTTLIGLGIVVYALKSRVLSPESDITAGDFVVYVAFMFSMMKPIKDLNSLFVGLQRGLVVAGRVFEIMDRKSTILEKPGAKPIGDFQESVEYRNVSFAYRENTPVLKGISFKIRKGEVVALVGPSGGGKSTLADLLPRLYDPDSGAIMIDGHDLRDITLASLRGKMGVVTQETVLFHDTVRNNIAYGLEGVTGEAVRQAAGVANAVEFIEELPQQYDTVIGERGTLLSGGQRQRLCIARAVLRNPEILVLDEATSALDNESEAKVQEAIDRLIENRTALVIAHRLSTVKRADRILVVENGEIREQGTHEELMKQGGTYKRLYELQFRDV